MSPSTNNQTFYSSLLTQDCLVHELEKLQIVYHRPSGQTHILAEDSGIILKSLEPSGQTLNQLITHLTQSYDLFPTHGIEQDLNDRLSDLARLGLVHISSSS